MCWCWYEEQDSYFFRGGVSRFKDTDGRYESGRRMPSWKISFVLKTLNQFDKKKQKILPHFLLKKHFFFFSVHYISTRSIVVVAKRSSRNDPTPGRGSVGGGVVVTTPPCDDGRSFFFSLTSLSFVVACRRERIIGCGVPLYYLKKGTSRLKEEGTKGCTLNSPRVDRTTTSSCPRI